MPSNFNNQELTEIKFNGVDVSEAYFNNVLVFNSSFVSTWRTTTANETITLPTPTNYPVNWGDGTSTTNANSHVYATAGDYEIKIRGDVNDFAFNNLGDKDKILEVSNFGGLRLDNLVFYGCANLDITNTKSKIITSALRLFRGCSSLVYDNGSFSTLDTTNVINFQEMLFGCTLFNQEFNLNVDSAENLSFLLYDCTNFNQSTNLNATNNKTTQSMLYGCTSFNSSIALNTENVTTMEAMFFGCILFNQTLYFNTQKVENLNSFLYGCSLFNQNINFTTPNLLNVGSMFRDCINFNSLITLNTSIVTDFGSFLYNCTSFNQDINIDTSSGINFFGMFYNCTSFNQPLNINTSNAVSFNRFLFNCQDFNHPLNFNTSNVTDLSACFLQCYAFNQDISTWSFVSVTTMSNFMTGKTDSNYDANYLSDLLIKLDQDLVFANMTNVNLGFGTIKYDSTGVTAYNSLVSKGFIIQSGGQV